MAQTTQQQQQQFQNQEGPNQQSQEGFLGYSKKGKDFFSRLKNQFVSEPQQDNQGAQQQGQQQQQGIHRTSSRKSKGQKSQEKANAQNVNKSALVVDDDKLREARKRYDAKNAQSSGRVQVTGKDDYYELLNVPKDANDTQIRKQYYLLARQYHPDKNQDDPQAKERFQKLGEAYQVLSNPDARKRYDQYGSEGVDNMEVMDQAEFFNMLFGSDKFEPLIGELLLTSAAKVGGELGEDQVKKLQDERVQKLVSQLQTWLEPYIEGGTDDFKNMMTAKAQDWVTSNFGSTILRTVGRVYVRQAEIYSGKLFSSQYAKIKQQKDIFKNQFSAIRKVLKVMTYENQMERDLALLEQQYNVTKDVRDQLDEQELTEEELQKIYQERTQQETEKKNKEAQEKHEGTSEQKEQTDSDKNGEGSNDSVAQQQQNQMEYLMQKAKLEEGRLPIMLEAMWAANSIDVENTIRIVCTQLFQAETEKNRRIKVSSGLKLFGDILKHVAAVHEEKIGQETQNAKEQFEKAMEEAIKKKMQQEDAQYGDSPQT